MEVNNIGEPAQKRNKCNAVLGTQVKQKWAATGG